MVRRWLLASLVVTGACAPDPGLTDDEDMPESWYCRQVKEWYPDWKEWEHEVFELVNERREDGAACGGIAYPPTQPLHTDHKLACAARKHALDMQTRGYVSHQSPDGETPPQRIRRAGYVASTSGENIAVVAHPLIPLPDSAEVVLDATHIRHRPSPARAVELWMGSKPHCRNIMNEQFTDTGVGYLLAADGAPIFTQSFARGVY